VSRNKIRNILISLLFTLCFPALAHQSARLYEGKAPGSENWSWEALIYPGTGGRSVKVPEDAPPIFIVAASDDRLAPAGVQLNNDWLAAKRSAEIHIYAKGGHGFGMRRQNLPSDSNGGVTLLNSAEERIKRFRKPLGRNDFHVSDRFARKRT
jgi:acetyl esterase/lipase